MIKRFAVSALGLVLMTLVTFVSSESRASAHGSVVLATDRIYGLAPDGNGVYSYNGTPGSWTKIGGPALKIYGGDSTLCATSPGTGDIYLYNGTPMSWTKIGGPGSDFIISGSQIFGVTPDGSGIWKYNGTPLSWTQVGGPGKAFAIAGSQLYGLTPDG